VNDRPCLQLVSALKHGHAQFNPFGVGEMIPDLNTSDGTLCDTGSSKMIAPRRMKTKGPRSLHTHQLETDIKYDRLTIANFWYAGLSRGQALLNFRVIIDTSESQRQEGLKFCSGTWQGARRVVQLFVVVSPGFLSNALILHMRGLFNCNTCAYDTT
jgi:hypothetical protein